MNSYFKLSGLSGLVLRTQALCVVSNRVWVQIPVMTLLSLSETLSNHKCFIQKVGNAVHSALPVGLLVYETLAYILTDCEGGNLVSTLEVGGNVSLVVVALS